ncbi:methyltransferase domain-containing protein [Neisseria weaveri]|uniref:methyltransferase domain-containing protein n=1 Tax=Neisseria weaveri TaxID=28091 RepID=UPI000D327218|nr:methyltransferase domain-containing protein [Neisseria weaveri]
MKTTDRWFIHRRLAEDTDERLLLVRRTPQHILLVGADADISRVLLAARYPKATFSEYDHRADFLQDAAAERKTGFLAKLTGKAVPQFCQSLTAPLPEAAADMLWANLSLINAEEPLAVFENWARALKTDGLLFFTHFGADSLPELLQGLKEKGITVEAPMLFDMHDIGDMLFHHGFYDPVMDTAKLQLNYRNPSTLWQDLETLGLWQSLKFDNEAAARRAVNEMFEQGRLNTLTLEILYGHAVRKLVLPEGESPVQFFPKRP